MCFILLGMDLSSFYIIEFQVQIHPKIKMAKCHLILSLNYKAAYFT